jgi:hypothetical protein
MDWNYLRHGKGHKWQRTINKILIQLYNELIFVSRTSFFKKKLNNQNPFNFQKPDLCEYVQK